MTRRRKFLRQRTQRKARQFKQYVRHWIHNQWGMEDEDNHWFARPLRAAARVMGSSVHTFPHQEFKGAV